MDSKILLRLLEIGHMMAETRALRPLLNYAVNVSLELFDAEYGFLVLLNNDGTLDFVVHRDRTGNDIPHPEQQISSTIVMDVVNSGEPMVTSSALLDPAFKGAESINSLRLRSVLCVPLKVQQKILGVLYLENRSQDNIFSTNDLEPLSYFASQAAICIQNAMLNDQLQTLAQQREFISFTERIPSSPDQSLGEIDMQLALREERVRVMSGFIENASHQFRTPLSVINTSVDLIGRKIDTESVKNYMDTIQKQVHVVTDLVDSLVEIVRLDSLIDIETEPLDIGDLARDMVHVFGQRMRNANLKFTSRINRDPIMVMGEPELLRQAMWHLLDNAVQYSNKGGLVTFGIHAEKDVAIVTVEDTGIGIPQQEIDHIFSRYYRVDKAGTSRGLGLGLSVVRRIMEIHDGDVEAESKLGEGSIFRLIIPAIEVN